MGYSTTIVQCLSCSILFLTIRHAQKLTNQVKVFHENVRKKQQLSAVVTVSHAIIILATTIVAFLLYNVFKDGTATYYRLLSALLFLTAVQDMFLSYNMFFIFEESNQGAVYRDRKNNLTYAVVDPFKRDS